MEREKQIIEEMAKVMCGGCADGKECMQCLCADWYRAEALYNAGYRKEIKAEWVYREDHGAYESPHFCSNCLADGSHDIDGEHYCYSCGARMVNAKYRKPR